jgi:hypothetical protein
MHARGGGGSRDDADVGGAARRGARVLCPRSERGWSIISISLHIMEFATMKLLQHYMMGWLGAGAVAGAWMALACSEWGSRWIIVPAPTVKCYSVLEIVHTTK